MWIFIKAKHKHEQADLMEQSNFGVLGLILKIRSNHTFCLGEIIL
jgi:hypothetical protein